MERDNIKVNTFGLWQTEIYVPPPVVNVSTNTFFLAVVDVSIALS